MVDGNNYVSSFMVDALGGARDRLMVNELVPRVVLHWIYKRAIVSNMTR